jgi:metal-responsive CopG/Arc/MetJ family transcriptional regulator
MRSVLSISVTRRIASDLDRAAKRLGVPRSLLVRQAVEHYVLELDFQELRRRLRIYAEKAGVLTEEDVFDRVS